MLDVAVIGAGVAGLYQLHLLRPLGLSVRAFEAADDVGGTWWWNRYPGARFDSESYTYAYSFSDELVANWRWSEHFAAQPETLRYLQHVADRFDLRRDITFGVRLVSAHWADADGRWSLGFDDGTIVEARHVVLASGRSRRRTSRRSPGSSASAASAFTRRAGPTAKWRSTVASACSARARLVYR